MKRGSLIIFEGVDGSGKSTQVKRLAEALRARGLDVVETREPTSGTYGQKIRAMASSGEMVPPETELEWFMQDRREHVAGTIRPALERRQVVVSDRYYLSTVTYQGARGLDPAEILNQSEAEFPIPDLVILLEIEVEQGLGRVDTRGEQHEPAFEEAGFLGKVAEEFEQLDLPYLIRIDGSRTPNEVASDVLRTVHEKLGL